MHMYARVSEDSILLPLAPKVAANLRTEILATKYASPMCASVVGGAALYDGRAK